MRLIVDGIVYGRQRFGGINTMFNAVLPRLAKAHDVSVKLLLPSQTLGDLPDGSVNKGRREILPEKTGMSWKFDNWLYAPASRLANTAFRELQLGWGRDTIYQSTYFTWTNRRVPQLATAYDLNHELFPELYPPDWSWLRKQYREYLQNANRIVAISAKTKSDIVNLYQIDPNRIDIVYLAVDQNRFHPDHNGDLADMRVPLGWEGHYLFHVGGRGVYKNFKTVLMAIAKMPVDLCAGVVVAGCEWSSGELEMLHSLGIEDRVHLVRDPTDAQVRRLYSSCLGFVFPSIHEGFGIPLLEAMSCGAPVIAADTQIFREIADDAALFFPPKDPEELIAVVKRLRNASERAQLLERQSRRLQEFSWDRCATEMYAAYRRTLETLC